MRLDQIDEIHLSLFPYVAGEGTRLLWPASPSPTGSPWSPAAPPAAGPSGCSTAGTANPGDIPDPRSNLRRSPSVRASVRLLGEPG